MKRIITLSSFVFLISLVSIAQVQITPFVIGSTGVHGVSGNMHVSYTVGECLVTTVTSSSNILTQGFHQPITTQHDSLGDDSLGVIYTGFSPNGDDKNDTWFIPGVDSLENTVTIFNRWGNLVWRGDNYNNTTIIWDGKSESGSTLPSGTYFYVIQLTGFRTYKGWVELIR